MAPARTRSQDVTGVVASGHPLVTQVAADMLRAGGNAFDAAVAAGFVAAVAEPTLTSLGGGGFLLARTASGQKTLFDFFVDTPGRGLDPDELEPHFLPVNVRFLGAEQVFHVGRASVAVPGCLRGYLHVHRRLGRLPLAEVLAPAITWARQGVTLNPFIAYTLDLLRPILALTEQARSLFKPGGLDLGKGDVFVNHELAAFMETLSQEGDRAFYEGETAERIAEDMRQAGGMVTAEDLARYRVIERRPLRLRYRDAELFTNPPPSFGGALIALSLELLEAGEGSGLEFGSPRHLLRLAAVMEEVDRLRDGEYLEIEGEPERLSMFAAGVARLRKATRGTTHVSVCDGEGNAASMTTSNGEGSGYVVPGTGIILNNMMGEDDLHPRGFHSSPPGLRISSMMSPSVLVREDGTVMALGSGGSKRIRTAILQVLCNVIDFKMPLPEAVAAPRMHHNEGRFELEPGFDSTSLETIEGRWPVNVWAEKNMYFGGVHAVTSAGEVAGDHRRGGSAQRV